MPQQGALQNSSHEHKQRLLNAKNVVRTNLTQEVRLNHTEGVEQEPKNPSIEEAYARAGGRKKVQESLRVTKATLSDWKRWGYVPVSRCPELERLSGVSRRKLNPNFAWGEKVRA